VVVVAGFGPPPSESKRRRNKDEFEDHAVTVATDDVADSPELPGADEYSARTRAWYETWRRAPQASIFTVTDWQRLHMLAPLVEEYWREPRKELLSEIRLNESLLGATHVDRMRGRIKVEPPKPTSPKPPANVADLTQRRRRLTDAS
jgi:hypothetical protein